jgi:isopropylmalate/homocitrate/citramalate synthase
VGVIKFDPKKIGPVEIIEVGPRDGLQNEPRVKQLSSEQYIDARLRFILALADAGLKDIEVGSFVRADLVPQMAGTAEILKRLRTQRPELWRSRKFWALVPNVKGLEAALKAGSKHIAVFTATSETFCKKNIRMSVRDSLKQIKEISKLASSAGISVRAYISTVWGCPYEGRINPNSAFRIADQLLSWGAEEISLGDTIGVATPNEVSRVLNLFSRKHPLAVHFHDTRGTALANSLTALDWGIRRFDSSAGGLGGCPFAPGAAGNLSTEDLLYMFDGMKLKSGVRLDKVCEASEALAQSLALPPLPSRVHRAWLAKQPRT